MNNYQLLKKVKFGPLAKSHGDSLLWEVKALSQKPAGGEF